MIAKKILCVLLTCGLIFTFPQPSSAQSIDRQNKIVPESPLSDALAIVPLPNRTIQPSIGVSSNNNASIDSLTPPFPFNTPQVGPLVKRQTSNIETRTRGFEPKVTDGTELFEFPDNLGEEEHWIRVDLTEQTTTAYKGTTPVRSFLISSGLPGYNTVTGEFRVWLKVAEQVMSGGEPGTSGYYYLPNVKWVMYFYGDYGLHGSYWHDNFGNPMSHGCVNMTNADAKWLFDFTGPEWDGKAVTFHSDDENPGARVIVHY
jgi:lipoprotein-anchoring transpeptidase ErfK/SrfK